MVKVLPFRKREKEGIDLQVPPEIGRMVRRIAADQRRSVSEVGTEALAKGLGLDPAQFGIVPQTN